MAFTLHPSDTFKQNWNTLHSPEPCLSQSCFLSGCTTWRNGSGWLQPLISCFILCSLHHSTSLLDPGLSASSSTNLSEFCLPGDFTCKVLYSTRTLRHFTEFFSWRPTCTSLPLPSLVLCSQGSSLMTSLSESKLLAPFVSLICGRCFNKLLQLWS